MIKDFLDDVIDFMMDYIMPLIVIGMFVAFFVLIVSIPFKKDTLEQTVETCVMEQKEKEPECKFAILKYTRKQNHTTVVPVPAIITHK